MSGASKHTEESAAASVEDYELEIIRTISIETPKVIENIRTILDKAALAEDQLLEAREIGGDTTLITKLGTTDWNKSKFYPKKQKIVELILKDTHKAEEQKEQKEEKEGKGSDYIFYPKSSRRVPMLDDNMGPTGWLLKHENYGGDSRINLFNENNSIIDLAKDYIYYRNRNIPLFFELYVEALKGKSKNNGKLSKSIIEGFKSINTKIQEGKLDKDGLNGIGVGVLSFCQTWAKQNKETGDMYFGEPQFSVMSPHFQTRFYIKNLAFLKEHIPEFPEIEYKRVLKNFMSVMVDYNGSFVNIDELIIYKIIGGRRKGKLRKKKTKKTMQSRKKKKTRGGKKSRRRKKTRRKKTKRRKNKRRNKFI